MVLIKMFNNYIEDCINNRAKSFLEGFGRYSAIFSGKFVTACIIF